MATATIRIVAASSSRAPWIQPHAPFPHDVRRSLHLHHCHRLARRR
jgi:hypothetical protein